MALLLTSNLIFRSYLSSDFFGKLIFFALFALSIISWLVLLQKTWSLYLIKRSCSSYLDLVKSQKTNVLQINKTILPALIKKQFMNPYHEIYFSTKEKVFDILKKNQFFKENSKQAFLSKSDIATIDDYLKAIVTQQIKRLEKNLFILSTIVSLAPFLGILGTVWGILISLFEMQSAHSYQSSNIILSGLSTALATTVLGLLIAIPALICYSFLKNLIKNLYYDMSHFSQELLVNIELQYRSVDQ